MHLHPAHARRDGPVEGCVRQDQGVAARCHGCVRALRQHVRDADHNVLEALRTALVDRHEVHTREHDSVYKETAGGERDKIEGEKKQGNFEEMMKKFCLFIT